eukprot:4117582-Prymnesium_polylepis.1
MAEPATHTPLDPPCHELRTNAPTSATFPSPPGQSRAARRMTCGQRCPGGGLQPISRSRPWSTCWTIPTKAFRATRRSPRATASAT